MQNIDFHSGNSGRSFSQFEGHDDSEFLSRFSGAAKDQERINRRASRMIFLISALCIVCFTTGLAIGIKFAGGDSHSIVDDRTAQAVSELKTKVSDLVTPTQAIAKPQAKDFPVKEFPYVIRIGDRHSKARAKEIASYLSGKGHTVILSKKDSFYRIYTGPYKSHNEARSYAKKLDSYQKFSISANSRILQRQ